MFRRHTQAEEAVKQLQRSGLDMKTLSIVGKGYHTDEDVVGYYTGGDRMMHRGKYGAAVITKTDLGRNWMFTSVGRTDARKKVEFKWRSRVRSVKSTRFAPPIWPLRTMALLMRATTYRDKAPSKRSKSALALIHLSAILAVTWLLFDSGIATASAWLGWPAALGSGERRAVLLSVYDHSVLANRPLYGARLTNTTGKDLLHGPVTVYDGGAYAGDARIETLPPGQERLITYGIDLDLLVDAGNGQNQSTVVATKIVDGVLHLSRRYVLTQKYAIASRSPRSRGTKPASVRTWRWWSTTAITTGACSRS